MSALSLNDKTLKPWALISVTSKAGLIPFAKTLVSLDYRLLSTGGTAQVLREAGLPVTEVSEYTKSPEILDGRVKTLHPKIHGGLLFERHKQSHIEDLSNLGIEPIDIVVVNLYPFEEKVPHHNITLNEAIPWIDVGGPTMLRAAAKNHEHVLTVCDPKDYDQALEALSGPKELLKALRLKFAAKVFRLLASYDQNIAEYLDSQIEPKSRPAGLVFPQRFSKVFNEEPHQISSLRYGENPQQQAVLYGHSSWGGLSGVEVVQGKELSYNNLLDLDASCQIVKEFETQAVVIVKHTNPCGVAAQRTNEKVMVSELVARARSCDPKSAFGGILAANSLVDEKAAIAITEHFMECVIAPEYTHEALLIFAKKPSLRVLRLANFRSSLAVQVRSVLGGLLVQTVDDVPFEVSSWRTVAGNHPSPSLAHDLLLADRVAKHVKSNAIVLVKNGQTIGIGAGQMSRIDAARVAVLKAEEAQFSPQGSVLASDAFFPFSDTVEFAAAHGICAMIQPGGSVRDQDSVEAAQKHGLTMIMTGIRHFRH